MSETKDYNNEKALLELREADTLGGMALKSVSEHDVSNMRKVSDKVFIVTSAVCQLSETYRLVQSVAACGRDHLHYLKNNY